MKDQFSPDPFEQFSIWYDRPSNSKTIRLFKYFTRFIQKALSVFDPALSRVNDNAFILTTSNEEFGPTSRVVLLKSYSLGGFVFFTNYSSLKSKQLLENPRAQILFYWRYPLRQIRIKGVVEKLSFEESRKYWKTRPRGSQISALASHQSSEVNSKQALIDKVNELKLKYKGQDIPCPEFWGGYCLVPTYFEFWRGRVNRLHDRVFYKKENNTWSKGVLAP